MCQHGAPQWVVSSVSKRNKAKFGAAFTVCSRSERSHVHITGTYNSEESQRTSTEIALGWRAAGSPTGVIFTLCLLIVRAACHLHMSLFSYRQTNPDVLFVPLCTWGTTPPTITSPLVFPEATLDRRPSHVRGGGMDGTLPLSLPSNTLGSSVNQSTRIMPLSASKWYVPCWSPGNTC